jgi:hypothetical protein
MMNLWSCGNVILKAESSSYALLGAQVFSMGVAGLRYDKCARSFFISLDRND